MKKIIFLIGSPRKKGNTSLLADQMIEHIDKSKSDIEKIFLYDYSIKPCRDCRACKKDELVCVVQDDMHELYQKMDSSDILVFGTPIYWFGPTAQTKLLVDRFRPYFVNHKLKGKKAVLMMPAGIGAEDCDLTTSMFKRVFDALDVEFIDSITAKAYDKGDVLEDMEALNHAKQLSETINSL